MAAYVQRAKKLLPWLAARHPHFLRPALSTAGDLLRRKGLAKRRRRRRRWYTHPGVVPAVTTAPNELWTADFKGHSARATACTVIR
jgi:transposase InsO family protein